MSGRTPLVNCPMRQGIICDRSASCDGCGWNPEVEQRRIRAIQESRKPKQQFIRQSFVPGEHKNIFLGRRH